MLFDSNGAFPWEEVNKSPEADPEPDYGDEFVLE